MIKQLFEKNLKSISKFTIIVITFFVCIQVFYSCKSIPIAGRSTKNDFNEYLFQRYVNSDFNYFSCEQVDVTLLGSENRRVKAKVYVHKGEYIFVNILFMGIELGRAELTPDSIKIINRFSKTFYFDELKSLKLKLNLSFTYDQLELLLLKGIMLDKNQNKRKFSNHLSKTNDSYVFYFANEDSFVVSSTFDKQSFYESKIEVSNGKYSNFNLVANIKSYNKSGTYPELMNVYFQRSNDSKEIEIKIGEILNKSLDNRSFIVNNKYREMEF